MCKKVCSLLLIVSLCLLCAGCSAPKAQPGTTAVDPAILTAFDSSMADTQKAWGTRFVQASGDSAVFAGTLTASWYGRDMETNILYLPSGDVVRTLNAQASYPLDDSTKAFLVDCLTALQGQFGDPVQCCYREFPTDGEPGGGAEADLAGDGIQAVCDGLWSREDLRSLEAEFPLPLPDGSPDETGSRRVHFACSKDADAPGQVNVSFVLEDPARAARAAGVLR